MADEIVPSEPKPKEAKGGFSLVAVLVLILLTAAVFGLVGWWAGTQQADVEDEGLTTTSVTPPIPVTPSVATSATAKTSGTATTSPSASTTATSTATTSATAATSAEASVVVQ